MGRQESNDLVDAEARIGEPLDNRVDGVGRLRDSQVGGRSHGWGTTEEEVQLGSTWTVGRSNSGSQVDEVTGGQIRCLEDRELLRGDIVNSAEVFEYSSDSP